MTHTPGPWIYSIENGGYSIRAHKSSMIADIPTDVWISVEEQKANAHLIAAAPDLLAALETLVRVHDTGQSDFGCLEIARAAIAKAKGEK